MASTDQPPDAMDVAALNLIIENLVQLYCQEHGDDAGYAMLGGMYLAVLLMNDPDIRPLAQTVFHLDEEHQPRTWAAYRMIRSNLVDQMPVPLRPGVVDEDYEAWRAERLEPGEPGVPGGGTLLDGPWD